MQTFVVYLIRVKYLIVKTAAERILEAWFSIYTPDLLKDTHWLLPQLPPPV